MIIAWGCWATLAEPPLEGETVIYEGYATTESYVRGADYDWVCPSCFELFKSDMGWVEMPDPENT